MGQSPSSENYTSNPTDHILVQGNADLKEGRVFPRIWTTEVTKTAEPNDIILTVRAPVGDVALNDYNVVLGRGVSAIKGNYFVFQLLKRMNMRNYWKKYSTGSTFDSINSIDINTARVIVPNKSEQNYIGKMLTVLDNIITLEQEKLLKYEQAKENMLTKLFPIRECKIPELRFKSFNDNWIHRPLSEISNIVGGGTPSTKIKEYWFGDINWFTPTEIGKDTYVFSSNRKITKLGFDKSSAKLLPKDKTILFTSRAGIGDTAILKEDASTNQGFQSLIVNDNTDIYFLFSLTETIKREAIRRASGSTFLEISRTELGKINIAVPTYSEQVKVGLLIEYIDNIITLEQARIEHYRSIKKNLLYNLFI